MMNINRIFSTIDTHAGGEPLRIITSGFPHIKGETILQRRAFFKENLDHIRKILMYEPRGHHGMYGCIITPPVNENSDFGVLFMHNEGLSTMCGHGIIAVVTVAFETGILEWKDAKKKIIIDSPAGQIIAQANLNGNRVESVSFENVPSFVFKQDVPVQLCGAEFTVDIAFGGAFYAVVNASDLGVKVNIPQLADLQSWGRRIKKSIEDQMLVQHPIEKELQGIYGVIISDEPDQPDSHFRNVTIFADEQIDRSPCGTGTAARMATLYTRGQLAIGEKFVHESIINTQFSGKILSTSTMGPYKTIIPQITGKASITGLHQFVVDPSDPLAAGFLLS
jgi:proline racemase